MAVLFVIIISLRPLWYIDYIQIEFFRLRKSPVRTFSGDKSVNAFTRRGF
jgi:hypothetical protein